VIDCDFERFSCLYSSQPNNLQSKLSIARGFAPRAANTTSFTRAPCAVACHCLSSGEPIMVRDGKIDYIELEWASRIGGHQGNVW
jgi:hypothetical protein